MSEIFNMDCMDGMKQFPDKYFELAIVDPPDCAPNQDYFDELVRVSKNQIIWGGNYFPLPPNKKPIIWDKQQPEGIDQAMFEYAWSSIENQQAKIFRRSPSADKNCTSNGDPRARQTKMRIHPTQKPIALYKWLLKHYANEGDKILDTHLGSGSSRIAADDMGFDFTGYELDKDYFEASIKRFDEYKSQVKMFA